MTVSGHMSGCAHVSGAKIASASASATCAYSTALLVLSAASLCFFSAAIFFSSAFLFIVDALDFAGFGSALDRLRINNSLLVMYKS